jgi:fluoroquinolone resistance protein
LLIEVFLAEKEIANLVIENLDLQGQILKDREYDGCTFSHINFQQVDFSRTKFLDCKFINCDLSKSRFTSSTFRDCEFNHGKMIGIDWTLFTDLSEVKIHYSDLSYGNFTGRKLRHFHIEDSTARECEFGETDLSGSVLSGTDFKGSTFRKANLSKCDFSGSGHLALNPQENILKDAKIPMTEALSMLSVFGIKIVN